MNINIIFFLLQAKSFDVRRLIRSKGVAFNELLVRLLVPSETAVTRENAWSVPLDCHRIPSECVGSKILFIYLFVVISSKSCEGFSPSLTLVLSLALWQMCTEFGNRADIFKLGFVMISLAGCISSVPASFPGFHIRCIFKLKCVSSTI